MARFQVADMQCGHCAGKISAALKQLDSEARIAIDTAAKTVAVESDASAAELAQAIRDAGFAPVALA